MSKVPPQTTRLTRVVSGLGLTTTRGRWTFGYSSVLGLLAIVLWFGPLRDMEKIPGPWDISPWILGPIFLAAQFATVRVHMKKTGATVPPLGIPMVLGLVGTRPSTMIMVWLSVLFISGFVRRFRWAPIQVYFNMAMHAFTTGCMVLIFRAIVDPAQLSSDHFLTFSVLCALYLSQIGELMTAPLIAGAVWIYDGEIDFQVTLWQLELHALALPVNTSIAIVFLVLIRWQPLASLIFLVPLGMMIATFRVYDDQRKRHEELNFLYEIAQTLQQSVNVRTVTDQLLRQIRDVFHAHDVELAILLSKSDTRAMRFLVTEDDAMVQPTWVTLNPDELRSEARPATPRRTRLGGIPRVGTSMSAVLRDSRTTLGLLRVNGRATIQMGLFRSTELKLFDAVAAQISFALERGLLAYNLNRAAAERDEATRKSLHDALTGLANRALFDDRVQHALARFARSASPIGVLFIDLDDFKQVNDIFGHGAGDQLLRDVADVLRSCSRQQDTVARFGGDEFAVLLEGLKDADEAIGVATRIVDMMNRSVVLQGREMRVGGSVGVATLSPDEHDVTAAELLQRADAAMYSAKQITSGRRLAVYANPTSVVGRRRNSA